MARDSFIFYRSFYDAIKEIPEEEQLKVYKAIAVYALEQEEIELTGTPKAIFSLVKPQLDANYKKYENGKQKGSKTKANDKQKVSKIEANVNDNVNVNVNVNDNNIPVSEEESSSTSAKANKHKHGKYKNVLLKDEELQKLKDEYSNWEELIKYLDEYIEMKGYKAKSHYLCIKKWVVDAVKKQSQKAKTKTSFNQREYKDLNSFYCN